MSEAASYTFRTAVGGFNRNDVAAYITKTAAEHQAKLEELEALRQENEQLRMELQQLRQECAEQDEAPERPEQEAAPEAPEPDLPEAGPSIQEQELTAYRRAEAAERLAFRRARQLYGNMQTICDDSARQFRSSEETAGQVLEQITGQLELLRQSIAGLEGSLQASAQTLEDVARELPEEEEV